MIRVKILDLVNSFGSDRHPGVMGALLQKRLPTATALRLRRVVKECQRHLDAFQQDSRELIDEYYLPAQEEGAAARAPKSEEAARAADEQYRKLAGETVELMAQPFAAKDFGGGDVFTTAELLMLEWLIPDAEEPAAEEREEKAERARAA